MVVGEEVVVVVVRGGGDGGRGCGVVGCGGGGRGRLILVYSDWFTKQGFLCCHVA